MLNFTCFYLFNVNFLTMNLPNFQVWCKAVVKFSLKLSFKLSLTVKVSMKVSMKISRLLDTTRENSARRLLSNSR